MMSSPTIAPANSGIGWSNGTAAQVSLPNMSMLRPRGYARIGPPGLRARSRWQHLHGDLLEQFRRGRAIRERCDVHALLREISVARAIERRAGGAGGIDPGSELLRRHGAH